MKLKPCPFCGGVPEKTVYPTLITIGCISCWKKGIEVSVGGDGPYSKWARENPEQPIDQHSKPEVDAEAKVGALWNTRSQEGDE